MSEGFSSCFSKHVWESLEAGKNKQSPEKLGDNLIKPQNATAPMFEYFWTYQT